MAIFVNNAAKIEVGGIAFHSWSFEHSFEKNAAEHCNSVVFQSVWWRRVGGDKEERYFV